LPAYRDLSFKLDFGKTKAGNFSLFGVYGLSDIEFLHDETDENDLFAADDEDSRADSGFGVIGLKHNYFIGENAYLRTVLAFSGNEVTFGRDRYYNQDTENEELHPFVIGDDAIRRFSWTSFVNKKFNNRITAKAGVLVERVNARLSFRSAEMANDANNDGIFDLAAWLVL